MSESSTIAEPMDDNQALREILGEVRALEGVIRQGYGGVVADATNEEVTSLAPFVRPENEAALKTVVTNTGSANVAIVYEGGGLVARLSPGESWVSPLSGAGEITVSAVSGQPATISCTTYERPE